MSATLGKRKRPSGTVRAAQSEDIKNGSDDLDDQRRVQEIFKKHFEARYKPLPVEKINEPDLDEQSDVPSSDDEAWSGFSSEEEPPVVEVDHANSIDVKPGSSKDEWKAFMVHRICLFGFTTLTWLTVFKASSGAAEQHRKEG